ncbi:MAG TPA: hypothetical protein VHC43_14155 [Mycobacteriales bacterium]|nr:hypothetical protein [Mycobacteriales bacterium]
MVAPSLSVSAEARLRELGWSWVTDAGQLHLRFPGHAVDAAGNRGRPARAPTSSARRSARGVGTFAVVRRMLLVSHSRQVELAAATGLTQPRISQILNRLAADDIVARDENGWTLTDWDRALQAWLSSYPGPRGVVTYWSGLDDVWSSTLTALDALPDTAVVSGDAAADLLAPWRQPRLATVYVTSMDDLGATGLVQVTPRSEGTVAVCVPDDRTVWPTAPITRTFRDRTINLADPVQVLRDVRLAEDDDARQAAERLVDWIKNQYVVTALHG